MLIDGNPAANIADLEKVVYVMKDGVVYDPAKRTRIGVATHHMNMDYSAYEGVEIAGGVDTVLSRGSVVVADGEFTGTAGHGQFVRRGLSSYLT